MPFKQTRVPRYLILEGAPRKPGWRSTAVVLCCILVGLAFVYAFMTA